MKKIWDGSEPTSAVSGQRPAFATAASASPEVASSQGSSNARGQGSNVPPLAPDAKFSRSPASAGSRQAAIAAQVEAIKANWARAPEIVVAANMQDAQIPQRVRDYDAKLKSQGASGEARAFVYQSKVYLLADQLGTPREAAEALFHEVLGHYGLRGAFGKSLDGLLRQLGAARRADVLAKAREYGLAPDSVTDDAAAWAAMTERQRLEAAEEVLAEMAQTRPDIGFVRRAIAAIRNWLRANVPGFERLKLTDAEIIRQFILPARGFVERIGGAGGRKREAAFSRVPPSDQAQTEAQRAEALIQQKAGKARPLEALSRSVARATGVERLALEVYQRGGALLERVVPEKIKAGIVSDYGVPEAVKDQRTLLQARQRVQLRKAGQLIEKLATLTRAESRVAYEWMNMQAEDPQAYLSMMQGLPEESVAVLQEVQQLIDRLSKEAVRLGQLDPEAFKRNRFAYLRRSYAKHTLEQTSGEKAKRARTIAVLGEQYKRRGLEASASMEQVKNAAPDWWQRKTAKSQADAALKGAKLVRMERRAHAGAGTKALPGIDGDKPRGKVLEIAYLPAGEPVPAKYADWDTADTWEVRTVKGPNVVLWRDFTKDERVKMGEIDEARFAIAKTLHAMIHDVETGRYLDWLAMNQAKKEGEAIPGTVVDASERMRDTFGKDEWVRVPDSKIAGTSVLKYGKLAGRYLPGPVWNDLRQISSGKFSPFGDTYSKVLSLWKTSKTALSPAVHMNNVLSNFVMADWHDVHATHVSKALRILLAANQKKGGLQDQEAAQAVLLRYQDSGGDAGSWATQEISREQIEPLLVSLETEMAANNGGGAAAHTGVFAALQHAMHLRFAPSWDAAVGSKPGKAAAGAGRAMLDLYQAEDDVFRLAAWLAAKEEGATDLEAGKRAKKSFLDYSINAPWINAMRQSAWPFLSFTYRAVPMLLETAGKKPHKLLKLMAVAGGLNALGSMLAGGDDDEERKLLPEEKAGKIWGMVPKLIRMPWNDGHGSPVFLDARRWVPVGDVFDIGQGHSAVPILPGLMPGGPLVLMGEVVLNRSAFTGKPITLETDTPAQQATKVTEFLYKAFMPNVLGLPGTYATEGVAGSLTGRTDTFGREMSTAQAVASSFGVKLGSYPADVLRRNIVAGTMAQVSELDRNLSQLKRQRMTGRLDAEEFNRLAKVEQEKKIKLAEKMREKLN